MGVPARKFLVHRARMRCLLYDAPARFPAGKEPFRCLGIAKFTGAECDHGSFVRRVALKARARA